jgi:parallel beta-helix repeat protein
MNRKTASEIMLTLLLVGSLTLFFKVQPVKAVTQKITVPDDYLTIQEAIDAANPRDTIFVRARTYYENLAVNKTVFLIGENRRNTVIDGNVTGTVVNVTANNVVINGFTIRNSGTYEYGVYIYGCSNANIQNSTIANNGYGIYLMESSNNTIFENSILANLYGISFHDFSTNNTISRNVIMGNGEGIYLDSSNNNTICKNHITNNYGNGIRVESSKNNTICENNIASNGITLYYIGCGIYLGAAHNNTVSRNNIADNGKGLYLSSSDGNRITKNNITNNWSSYGLEISSGSSNIICHNNFINNRMQVYNYYLGNIWDDGYPSGGNYWSDYNGSDLYYGPSQNVTGSDGIGDMPHYASFHVTDNYPLMGPINTFDIGIWTGKPYTVDIVSNLAVSAFQLNAAEKVIGFNVSGTDRITGFCRITIPNVIIQTMWLTNYTLLINSESRTFRNWTDATNTYIYVDNVHPENQVIIIPELSSSTILPLFLILFLLAIVLAKKISKKTFNFKMNLS